MPLTHSEIPAIVVSVDPRPLIRNGEPVIRTTIGDFGNAALAEVLEDEVFNVKDPRVVDYIRRWGADRVTGLINRTTRGQLRRILELAVDNGTPRKETAAAIENLFLVRSSGLTIAQTEIHTASSFANLEGYRQGGAPRKEWLSTEDNLVRDTAEASHVALDGQIVGIDEPFVDPVSGASGQYPGGFGVPAEDINCRCGVLPVLDERRLRRNRRAVWKVLERRRRPYERRLRQALARGFEVQKRAALEAFEVAYSD